MSSRSRENEAYDQLQACCALVVILLFRSVVVVVLPVSLPHYTQTQFGLIVDLGSR